MDIGRENQKKLQVENSWIPKTPFKPILPKPQVIYTNRQGNQVDQANGMGSKGFSTGLSQETRDGMLSACLDSAANGNWEAALEAQKGIAGDSSEMCEGFPINSTARWNFTSLLALQDQASAATTIAASNRIEDFSLGSNRPSINSNYSQEPQYAKPIPHGSAYDLNLPPIVAADSKTTFQIIPLTPEKDATTECGQVSQNQKERNKQENRTAITVVDTLQTDRELQELANDSSSAAICTLIKENHNPGNEGSHAIETPQRKPRRKRHRPKVITEGKPKTKPTAKPTPSTESPTGKRKYVRKKPLNKAPIPPLAESEKKPTGKRRYVRKKPLNKATTTTPVEATGESIDPKALELAKKSCRRSLNFDIEGKPIDDSSKCKLNCNKDSPLQAQDVSRGNQSKSIVAIGQGIEVLVEATQAGIAYDLADTVNQMLKDYMSFPEKQAPSTPLPAKTYPPRRKRNDNSQESHAKVEAQAIAHTVQQNTQIMLPADTQLPSVNPDGSNCSPCTILTEKGKANGSKRKYLSFIQQPDSCSTNLTGGLQSELQTYGLTICQTERPTKKRSSGPTRIRDLTSLAKIGTGVMHQTCTARQIPANYNVHQVEDSNKPHACIEALVAEMHGTLMTKKRTKKRVVLINSASSSTNGEQSHGKIILYNQSQFLAKSSGAPQEVIWRQMSPVDAIVEQLQQLDINRESGGIAYKEHSALVPYNIKNEQNALVLYRRDGTIIPFADAFEPIKKRRPRPKVYLDEETNRVWKLLLGNINSEGIDGTDEEKAKWWEEERKVFRGRANSFIARMHLVQGDRRFSQWKGSVVDSVIGVFLTQNVSDHLSSSAFMSLAARFPLKSRSNKNPCYGERTSSVIEKPIVCMPDLEEAIKWNEMSNQLICDQSSMTLHDSEVDEEQEVVNSNESSTSSNVIVSSRSGLETYYQSKAKRSTTETAKTADIGYIEEKRSSTNDAFSSQNSVISSQNSVDSPSAQTAERRESYSWNNSDAEDLIDGSKFNSWNSSKTLDIVESSSALNEQERNSQKTTESDLIERGFSEIREIKEMNAATRKAKSRRVGKEIRENVDWDALRKQAEANGRKRQRTPNTMDSLDWEAVRCADVNEIANTIKERGMNNMLAERIKNFLNRLAREHGSIDLEWLRDVPPDKAKEYLLSVRGLGLKSVECVRLLTLHHLAFPVDTNVGRIAVRLGWVPLQPLPESLQLHLLELYPVLESIQKYIWPRLCRLDQRTLYELHYQMITFGKVFCTKSKPNCNACPMRGECRHFASAFARFCKTCPGPEEKVIVSIGENSTNGKKPDVMVNQLPLLLPQATESSVGNQQPESNQQLEARYGVRHCEPIVEEPSSPEPECPRLTENDMEDAFCEDPDEIPTIKLNIEEFTQNLQNYMQENMELQEVDMSKALVALTAEAASIPTPKLKNVSQLRTEHQVYELPDSHPLLQGLDRREPDDPCSYLLAIWTPGETANSIQPPESRCNSQEYGKLCDEKACFSCNSIREANSQIVRGTLLIPCRTAMRGSFPLNGTYFQVNEVFADHDSSLNPIDVPRTWIWNLPRRTVYFGTSIPTIFKGLTTEAIQNCFWRGYVCVRGFDQKTRAPRPLIARLHFPASKLNKKRGKDSND
ncbi:hypothetical protein GH714_038529 [Hevea brasiliensis]|uniref:HhH-GPD domain-containing protein n=1 Tax=Hevea brasiliensis TaxID=3981 RepID=A0A6A6KMQ3_HEVBR|nr:hypothetical protein GH714_038529 [Hevea brasiliensis]